MCPFFENFQNPETEGVLILKFKRAKNQRYFDPEFYKKTLNRRLLTKSWNFTIPDFCL
jgi:hypothetical protein